MILHPRSGLHYTHIVPSCPAYQDTERSLRILSGRRPWLSVEPMDRFPLIQESSAFQDDRRYFILWGGGERIDPWDRERRRAGLALFHSETIGDPRFLHSDQRAVLDHFMRTARRYDLVFAHTPTAVAWIARNVGVRARLAPSGYDPEVLDRPDFAAPKSHALAFYGAIAGRRHLLGNLQSFLQPRIADLSGAYGLERQRRLSQARAILHVHHCPPESSFASFRLWQAVGTSAALLLEPTDAWPAVPGRHYLEYPALAPGGLPESARAIEAILEREDLASIARRAHEELSEYTPESSMERFIVPASMEGR